MTDLVGGLRRQVEIQLVDSNAVERLTARERQIMILVTKGLSNKEIARHVDLTEGTVKMHLHNSVSEDRRAEPH